MVSGVAAGHANTAEGDKEGEDVRGHVKTVCDEGERVGGKANYELHDEVGASQKEHTEETMGAGEGEHF